MIYGYCRVSTNRQVITRQVENILKVYPGARIYQEAYTGVTSDRQEWKKLKKLVSSGDTLVFDSVSRMSRNAQEGIQEYFELYNKGVNLIFLKEGYINSDVYTKAKEQQIAKTGNKITDILLSAIEEVLKVIAVDQIEKAFEQSEKEALDIRTRTKEGLKVKKAQGIILGRRIGSKIQTKKSIKMKEKIKLLAKDFGGNLKDIQVIELLKLSRNTYFKYKRELKEEL
ncbi:recombinase family protein [uncultured Fusobacterium sp.]|mgnify:FL=1|uniref:recombinase family protein n=1 Tax=uncultured Fusobacterium sp. TaxID=159267 RepID=UPI00280616A0|nr:recombinase family protein [uncultured Fusobacterium sp.]